MRPFCRHSFIIIIIIVGVVIVVVGVIWSLSVLNNYDFRRLKITRDHPTDGRTDTTSYRDARTHKKPKWPNIHVQKIQKPYFSVAIEIQRWKIKTCFQSESRDDFMIDGNLKDWGISFLQNPFIRPLIYLRIAKYEALESVCLFVSLSFSVDRPWSFLKRLFPLLSDWRMNVSIYLLLITRLSSMSELCQLTVYLWMRCSWHGLPCISGFYVLEWWHNIFFCFTLDWYGKHWCCDGWTDGRQLFNPFPVFPLSSRRIW